MGTSGNPAKKAEQQVSSVADFKKKKSGTITLPSGMIVQLRNPGGLRVFMRNGTIPNALLPMVEKSLNEGTEFDQAEAASKVDEKVIEEMMGMMDTIAVTCFVEPRCWPTPEKEEDRSDDKLYADEVDDEDKMFIFQWVSGGTADVEQFRAEQARHVASVSGQPKVVDSTQ